MIALANPTLPQVVPTRPTAPTGGTEHMVDGVSYALTQAGLQAAMDAASRGDIVTVTAGSTISIDATGLIMKRKAGTGYVLVRSSAHANFTQGKRVGPSDTADMFKLQKSGTTGRAISPEFIKTPGEMAHSWIWQGVEVTATTSHSTALVSLNQDATLGRCDSQAYEPHDIYFEHCYIHGDGTNDYHIGFEPGCLNQGIWDSTITNFGEVGSEAQAISFPSGTGGLVVDNCLLQGAGQCVFWGGGRQQIDGVNLADITVSRCDICWPASWDGTVPNGWTAKNLCEHKDGARVRYKDCTIHHCFAVGQTGYLVVMKENSSSDPDTWNRVRHITFENCKFYDGAGLATIAVVQGTVNSAYEGMRDVMFKNCAAWAVNRQQGGGSSSYTGTIEMTVSDSRSPQSTPRVHLRKCTVLMEDFGGSAGVTNASVLRWGCGDRDDAYDHWYVVDCILSLWGSSPIATTGFAAVDTLLSPANRSQQVNGDAIETAVPNHKCIGNVLIGDYNTSNFPAGNTKAATYAAVGFADWANGDLSLAVGSPALGAGQYGGNAGCDWASLDAATAHCIDGDWT